MRPSPTTAARRALATGAGLVLAMALAATIAPATATASTPTPSPTLQPAPPPSIPERFFAEYRDQCVYAEVGGELHWPDPLSAGPHNRVPVTGVLSERRGCDEERLRRTYAEFEAFADGRVVDRQLEYVVPADLTPRPPGHTREFRLLLTNQVDRQAITRIDVRMCRDFGIWLPATNCGETRSYWPPAYLPPQPPRPTMAAP